MSRIIDILEAVRDVKLADEDGEALAIRLSPPITERELRIREESMTTRIPNELRELLIFSNGISLFGQAIMSLEELCYFPEQGLVSFHNWGNGDFDCIATSSVVYTQNTVVFMNHSPEVTAKIEDSLTRWVERAIDEIRKEGTLLHPSDYRTRPDAHLGLYGGVMVALRGVNCELNR